MDKEHRDHGIAEEWLEDEEFGHKAIPSPKIVMLLLGTRGDVQPFYCHQQKVTG